MKKFPLQTDRLLLRSFQERDLETFAAYRSDPEVARYQGWDVPYPLERAAMFIAEMREKQPGIPGEWFQIAIERKQEAGLIGDCVFRIQAHDARQAEIGFTLSRKYQRQGYATEAVTGLLNYLFEMLNLHRVTAICDAENHASARLLEGIGMRREGDFVENIWFKGAWGSEYLYAVLGKEWER